MEYKVIDPGFRTGMPENLYIGKFSPKTGHFRDFFNAHAQKRPEYYFRFQNGPRIRNQHAKIPIVLYLKKNCSKSVILTRLRQILCCDNTYNGRNRDLTLIFMFSPKIWGQNIF